MTIVFLFALLAGCALSGESALVGTKKCTYGPSYWCHSLVKAKECNAVNHCIETVWEKTRLPDDDDDICTLCKDMVQQARNQLLSNETQEEIREVFEGSCQLIPIKLISDECIHLANDFIPELIDTLASEMNPQVVCATAGLCNSVKVDKLLLEYKRNHPEVENIIPPRHAVQTPQPGDCEACKDFVSRTIRLVKTHSPAELMDRLLAICGRLGSLSDGCMVLVQANFDDIYNFLTEQLTPDGFCDLVEMCEAGMHEVGQFQRSPGPVSDDAPCEFCEAMVQHWKNVLVSNTTVQEFKEILDGLCHQMGGFSDNCLALVDEYYTMVYELLVSEIDAKAICEVIGLCGVNSVFAKQPPVWTMLDTMPLQRLSPAIPINDATQHLTGSDEAAAIAFEEQQQHHSDQLQRVSLGQNGIAVSPVGRTGVVGAAMGKSHIGTDNVCVMCQFALHFLQQMLEQKDTREDIENAVESLCDMMPKSIAEQCEDYVEAYGDQVIELLEQEIDPSQVCPMLHLCPSENMIGLGEEEEEVLSDVSCVMCEYAMTQLEELLEDHKTEENIRDSLEKLCELMPKSVRSECRVFIDTYTDQIIHLLINDLTPDQVCTELHLCKPKVPNLPRLDSSHQLPLTRMFIGVPAPVVSNDIEEDGLVMQQSAVCVLCEFTMLQLDQLLLDNATESEIVEAVDFVCTHLPGSLADDCLGFVEQYGDSIIKLLAHELNPEEVCQEMSFCKPPTYKGLRATLNMNFDQCGICEFVVNEVDMELKDPSLVTTLEVDADRLCRLLPTSVVSRCEGLVEVYGPYLVDMIRELLVPRDVCEGLNLCPRSSQRLLVGGNKCTWGPSYWCQTKIHAASCKATDHCTQTVWRMNIPRI